jgi:hypothetical protein
VTPTSHETAPLMSRIEVSGLLAMMAAFRGRTPTAVELRWWRDELAGFSAPECQAAVLAHSKASPNHLTPADIKRRVREARRLADARRPRQDVDPRAQRRVHAASARRGMAEIYASMGWVRHPGQAAALSVPCPVPGCGAPARVICARVNLPEKRDPDTRVHPSRLAAGQRRAEQAGQVRA